MPVDIAAATWFGPATITALRSDVLVVATPFGERTAVSALGTAYRAVPGDVALVLQDADRAYVIGVLSGRGQATFDVGGDLVLRSGGAIRMQGARGVEIEAPQVSIRADRVETTARAVFERVVSCYRWVKDTLQVEAGRTRTTVEGNATLSAGRIIESAEKEIKLDAKQIHLG